MARQSCSDALLSRVVRAGGNRGIYPFFEGGRNAPCSLEYPFWLAEKQIAQEGGIHQAEVECSRRSPAQA